jgi:Zn-dependent protease/CBS domain-containing protein
VFGSSWRLGRVAGVEVRVDSSWTVAALLVTYSLYLRFSAVYGGLRPGRTVALALLTAALFFGSVLTHEMAHALACRARGIRVQDITLFLFGGATRARVESRGPRDEFLVAVVGPLTSAALALVFGAAARLARDALPGPVAGALGYLAWVNLILAGFNLVPGFPLDGGRLLRSAVWRATGSLARATRVACLGGQAVGWLLVAAGLGALATGRVAGGAWLAFVGWFLVQAARASYEDLQVRMLLRGVEAQDVMARDLVPVPPAISLQEAVDRYFMRYDHGAFPVEEGGRTVGLLTLRGVRRVPREEWPTRLVRDSMVPLGDQVTVPPEAPMDGVVAKLEACEGKRVLVVRDGDVVGIITPSDVARWLRRWEALGGGEPFAR